MKLWTKFKRLMPNRKKARVKKVETFPSPVMTTAERLIMNNWNVVVSNPEPARAGEMRAHERLSKKLKANRDIPVLDKPHSRQVRRAAERRDFKALRSMVKDNKRRQNMVDKGLIPT